MKYLANFIDKNNSIHYFMDDEMKNYNFHVKLNIKVLSVFYDIN